ncbi:selenium-dependent molybdenum cofactor biosynthesis protein YqeB [Miniphocaeibacter massiliensis]|uniref:selenium-dependent molybdenum cofactor biosynthesis protein YqeB n=1 Tax=Miniphocaeibacter massiliensis TaxID=2041841 RepID=UPI000C1C574F|nr:selenium-dependent molybdenum cofactor biosynthesis protein YqeB [Miniphocaeibacter massiliensis]
MEGEIVIVRGGGDIATGTIQRLHRSGFRVLVLEIEKPTTIRRTVAVSTALYNKEYKIEDFKAVKCENELDIFLTWEKDNVPVVVDPKGDYIDIFKPNYLVDAILAKKNIGFTKLEAIGKIALGPGFIAGKDADIVIETNRGHNLGRLVFEGEAEENTGIPGIIGGYTTERVIYSESSGEIEHIKKLGDIVEQGEVIAKIGDMDVIAKISGVLRGLINEGFEVYKGLKIADIDPRIKEKDNCFTISDKARAIGGSVLEAILILKNAKNI